MRRHYCTSCGRKLYEESMKKVYYKLLKIHAWHCFKCMSTVTDNLQYTDASKTPYLLELFSGSKTISRTAAENFSYRTCTIDVESKYNPDICIDIAKLRIDRIPERKKVSIVWASVPCTYYTILNIHNHWQKLTYAHRKYYYIPKTKEAAKAIQLLEKTIYIIKEVNPVFYFIENPRGALRHMPQIQFAPFTYTISYSDFEAPHYKPTDIFTNCPFLTFPKIKTAVGRQFKSSVAAMNDSYERSIVPPGLIKEIFSQIQNKMQ